jgi:thiol-disulfide isomerase/thioredoxin
VPRTLLIVVLAVSVAAGMVFSRLLLPPERAPDTALADEMRASAAQATDGSIRLPDLDGNERSLDDWAGNVRLVNFWATWCAPCRREIPLLKEIQAAHGDAGIQVIGIAVDDLEPVTGYVADMGFNYPVLVGQEDAIAAAESFGIDFLGLPFTLILNPEGELLNVHVGEFDREQAAAMIEVLRGYLDGSLTPEQTRSALADI